MRHRWDTVTFLHWPYDPADVQRLLPEGLTVEPYDGAAWVGLVPFAMTVRAPGLPPVPWASYFPETNVRTYVRGPGGTTGVWFFSLDASRLGAVAVARATLGLPYCWSRMRVGRRQTLIRYVSVRRLPHDRAHCEVEVETGDHITDPTGFDNYLTARFRLWTPRLRLVQAHHAPWPLQRATVRTLDPGLVTAAGLPPPETEQPTAHYSDGVDVSIGWPSRTDMRSTSTRNTGPDGPRSTAST
jgi:uncharacterized protein YqjF (DUF2071 family)